MRLNRRLSHRSAGSGDVFLDKTPIPEGLPVVLRAPKTGSPKLVQISGHREGQVLGEEVLEAGITYLRVYHLRGDEVHVEWETLPDELTVCLLCGQVVRLNHRCGWCGAEAHLPMPSATGLSQVRTVVETLREAGRVSRERDDREYERGFQAAVQLALVLLGEKVLGELDPRTDDQGHPQE